VGDKDLTWETPAQRGRVNRYVTVGIKLSDVTVYSSYWEQARNLYGPFECCLLFKSTSSGYNLNTAFINNTTTKKFCYKKCIMVRVCNHLHYLSVDTMFF
jgi:hypothetical protein